VLGDSELISGAGLELPQNGFNELLQPASNTTEDTTEIATDLRREGTGMLLPGKSASIDLPSRTPPGKISFATPEKSRLEKSL
jgi:hypothetical protein